jgi:hypothetical protein
MTMNDHDIRRHSIIHHSFTLSAHIYGGNIGAGTQVMAIPDGPGFPRVNTLKDTTWYYCTKSVVPLRYILQRIGI